MYDPDTGGDVLWIIAGMLLKTARKDTQKVQDLTEGGKV